MAKKVPTKSPRKPRSKPPRKSAPGAGAEAAAIVLRAEASPAPPATLPEPARVGAEILDRLYATIMDRRTADPARSHSARLLSRGSAKVAQKFGEEAVECLIEAVAGNPALLVAESADVLYHLVVMWIATGVAPDEVWAELHRREGVSGIEEKAARLKTIRTKKIP